MNPYACSTCHDVGYIYTGPLSFLSSQDPAHQRKCECNIVVTCKGGHERYDGPVHLFFSLSYASYFCVPRIVLQGMPLWWQRLFVWLMRMLPQSMPDEYSVQRRNDRGRFIRDDWANYRRGDLDQLLKQGESDGNSGSNTEPTDLRRASE